MVRMASTRTHTVYFDEDNLEPLTSAITRLEADWNARRNYMHPDTAAAGDARLAIVRHGLELLGEAVAE